MADLKNLKKISDSVLSDIKVSGELKSKTLKGLNGRKASSSRRYLIPAACAAALLLTVASASMLPQLMGKQAPGQNLDSGRITTMAAGTEGSKVNSPGSTFDPGIQVLETWTVGTMEEASKYIGGTVLTPSYMPEGYQVKEIMAAGPKKGEAISVVMEFESNGRSFSIMQNKVQQKMELGNSTKVDINGAEGYMSSFKNDDANNPIYSTDLKWYIGDMLYMVQGSLPEEEAVKVAKSLE